MATVIHECKLEASLKLKCERGANRTGSRRLIHRQPLQSNLAQLSRQELQRRTSLQFLPATTRDCLVTYPRSHHEQRHPRRNKVAACSVVLARVPPRVTPRVTTRISPIQAEMQPRIACQNRLQASKHSKTRQPDPMLLGRCPLSLEKRLLRLPRSIALPTPIYNLAVPVPDVEVRNPPLHKNPTRLTNLLQVSLGNYPIPGRRLTN